MCAEGHKGYRETDSETDAQIITDNLASQDVRPPYTHALSVLFKNVNDLTSSLKLKQYFNQD